MKLEQAKQQFVQTWGNFGSQWGINRSMAQVHAFLLVSDHSQCTEDVMESLGISRGNANMNIRELMNWNLIYKESVVGDRREFFRAEKDMWEVAKRIVKERKRRELEPLQHHLAELKKVEQSYESISFVATIENIERLVTRLDGLSNTLMKADEHVFFGKILNMFK
ncbi:MAG: transcriptional regulator [Fluviicola sp.]|nr:transcriptional regulator [Fluviicola sp.]